MLLNSMVQIMWTLRYVHSMLYSIQNGVIILIIIADCMSHNLVYLSYSYGHIIQRWPAEIHIFWKLNKYNILVHVRNDTHSHKKWLVSSVMAEWLCFVVSAHLGNNLVGKLYCIEKWRTL